MKQTTVYLEPDLKRQLERVARLRGQTEAAILREALRQHFQDEVGPPIVAVGQSDDGGVARQVDDALSALGFGDV